VDSPAVDDIIADTGEGQTVQIRGRAGMVGVPAEHQHVIGPRGIDHGVTIDQANTMLEPRTRPVRLAIFSPHVVAIKQAPLDLVELQRLTLAGKGAGGHPPLVLERSVNGRAGRPGAGVGHELVFVQVRQPVVDGALVLDEQGEILVEMNHDVAASLSQRLGIVDVVEFAEIVVLPVALGVPPGSHAVSQRVKLRPHLGRQWLVLVHIQNELSIVASKCLALVDHALHKQLLGSHAVEHVIGVQVLGPGVGVDDDGDHTVNPRVLRTGSRRPAVFEGPLKCMPIGVCPVSKHCINPLSKATCPKPTWCIAKHRIVS